MVRKTEVDEDDDRRTVDAIRAYRHKSKDASRDADW